MVGPTGTPCGKPMARIKPIQAVATESAVAQMVTDKKLLNTLEKNNKGLKHRIMLAMEKGSIDGLKL